MVFHSFPLFFHWFRELKREIEFEVYLEYVNGALSRQFKSRSGTHGLFEELGRHDKMGGSQECPYCGACKKSIERVLLECASCDSQRLDFFKYFKTVLPPDAFETFLRGNVFDKTAFCLGEKEDMLMDDECSSWYVRVGNFKDQFGIGENSCCIPTYKHA